MTAEILRRLPALKTFVANPVVVRDLRAQMRGTKSYYYQGGYLLLLGVLAIAGYAVATGQSPWSGGGTEIARSRDIVAAQSQLESFYYFIFLTLAALICVIGPALTASSVVGERQRLSLDLLVTTPLSAAQILIGKLVSSLAFLGLLLALSLPASALCIVLGGATPGDVFRAYLLLATDGIVLAGIGLYFSCAVRAPLLAMVWTYGAVAAFLGVTGLFATASLVGASEQAAMGRPFTAPLLFVADLNPFAAVLPTQPTTFSITGATIPLWPFTLLAAFLVLRLFLTAATYRLAAYGGASAPSLRRQVLVLTAVLTFLVVETITATSASHGMDEPERAMLLNGIAAILVGFFVAATPFLPGLFVPATSEDAPPGAVQDAAADPAALRPYVFRRAFRPEHAGALPYFHLWILALILGAVPVLLRHGFGVGDVVPYAADTAFYLSGLGFVAWAAARLARVFVRNLSAARASTFGLMVGVGTAPLLTLVFVREDWKNHFASFLWLFQPLLHMSPQDDNMLISMILSGVLGYAFGGALLWLASVLGRRISRTRPSVVTEA